MHPTREILLDLLYTFVESRPGIEPGNYASWSSYRQECRRVTRDLHDARAMLGLVAFSGISAPQLKAAFRHRLTLGQDSTGHPCIDYTTGQYYPVEYRKAVSRVAADALWDYYREDFAASAKRGESAGDAIRRCFRQAIGKRLADRFFN